MKEPHRPGELDAAYFDKLPQRAKEIFFEFLSCNYDYDGNKAFYMDVKGFYYNECKSPIEIIFNLAFDIVEFSSILPTSIYLCPQIPIKANNRNYVADFVFDTDDYEETCKLRPYKLVIECDGHDFHERTKAQVVKANERDFNLKMAGYDVLHFSGSQIFNEPFECARSAIELIKKNIVVVGDKQDGQGVDMPT